MKKIYKSCRSTFYGIDHFDTLIKDDYDCYKEDGKILFKYRKNKINKELHEKVINIFLKESKRNNNQRAVASGGKRVLKGKMTVSDTLCQSNVFGYCIGAMTKKNDENDNKIRLTCSTKKIAFDECVDFYRLVDCIYEELAPENYRLQRELIEKCPVNIHGTVFSTITTNYNFRTACHKDKGDVGLSCLVVLGSIQKECYIGFPDYKICVCVMPGDIIIMDSHEYHCNTELDFPNTDFRLSFVFYLRKNISTCRL